MRPSDSRREPLALNGGDDAPRDRMVMVRATAICVACALFLVPAEAAGQVAPRPAAIAGPVGAVPPGGGPPSPVPPEVITRDADGRATVRAVHLDVPLHLDGRLDEAIYSQVPAISDFVQNEPLDGAPASEKTEMWVFFDASHVYVSARCWETHPERIVANEMRRDGPNFFQNDHLAFVFDTFHDRRNSVEFAVNPIGGRADGQLTDERTSNGDWNPVWEFSVGRFKDGWTVEVAIPFSSLRYSPGSSQTWGFNARRTSRWRNEHSHITRVSHALGSRAIFQVSLAATLVGLEAPPGSRNLEIKPYVTSSLRSDATPPGVSNKLGGDFGLDVKYGITQNLTTDITYNPDFAQVEADTQQVNLTRFSLLFPEKREFFLENQGTFAFGGAAATGTSSSTDDTPILFYSRRIGLNQGHAVPLDVGGRLTGRVGRYSVGVLNIRSADDPGAQSPGTLFSVARLKRDVLRRSSVGAIFAGRSVSLGNSGANETYGVDGTFAFFNSLAFNTYWARTRTADLRGDDRSYRGQLDYAGDRYGVQLERLVVGEHFNPEAGYVRRGNMRRSFALARFSPRPRASRRVRKLSWTGSWKHIEDGSGRLQTRTWDGEFGTEFHNGDKLTAGYSDNYEFLQQPFSIASNVTLPVEGYQFGIGRAGFTFGQQRRLSGSVLAEVGAFYGGHRTAISVTQGVINVMSRLSIEPMVTVNRVELPQGDFTSRLVGSRVTFMRTPLMFMSALLQFNSSNNTVSSNVRLRWEYKPGSEIFLVYNDQRDTLGSGTQHLENRALVFKINRLFRF